MKNKKMFTVTIIVIFSLGNLSLLAIENEAIATLEHMQKNHEAPKESWFETHRTKVFSFLALCAGAYALHKLYNHKPEKTEDRNAQDAVIQKPLAHKKNEEPVTQTPPAHKVQPTYQETLEHYTNLTQEGSVYHTMLHEIGIDLLPQNAQEPETVTTDETAINDLQDKIRILGPLYLIARAWEKVKAQVKEIASLTWPTGKGSSNAHSLVGTDVEKKAFTQCLKDESDIDTLTIFTTKLNPLVKATLNKVEAALKAANKRSGEDQNNTMLSNLYEAGTSITVQDALARFKKGKPFEILQYAPKIINALASISNDALIAAKNDLKQTSALMLKLTGEGSAYRKAFIAQIPELPPLGKMPKNAEEQAVFQKELETMINSRCALSLSDIQKGLKTLNETKKQVEKTAVTEHIRQKITPLAHTINESIRRFDDTIAPKLQEYGKTTPELVFSQNLNEKSLDELIDNVIPEMITAILIKIDVGLEILKQKYKNYLYVNNLMEEVNALRNDKTYSALQKAAHLIERLRFLIQFN